jgi:hypothetical protein
MVRMTMLIMITQDAADDPSHADHGPSPIPPYLTWWL